MTVLTCTEARFLDVREPAQHDKSDFESRALADRKQWTFVEPSEVSLNLDCRKKIRRELGGNCFLSSSLCNYCISLRYFQ